ncbi:MAG: T9SS type A sorting domain-containing protein, partial [Bacteroidetes bacterium]|nr:T9SS type A sorting domain-containing protein [Bacteroidota bacterium]
CYVPVIYDRGQNSDGPYSIEVGALACSSGPTGPVNDSCASVTPQALNVGGTLTFTGDNTGATAADDFAPTSDFAGTPVVWHAFTTNSCANVTVSYCGQTPTWENTLGILSTDCPSDSVIFFTTLDACTDGNIIYAFDALAAGTYYVPVLLDPTNNAEGPYSIAVHAAPCDGMAPPNDTCTAAVPQVLSVGGSLTLQGDNTNATDNEGLGYASAWEAFTLTECAHVTLSYCGTLPAFGMVAEELYAGCPPVDPIPATSIVPDGCDFGDTNTGLMYDALAAGTYYIPVRMEPGVAEGAYTITLSAIACTVPPTNDDCAAATEVSVALPTDCGTASVEGDNSTATQGGTEPECGFPGSPLQDVWYTFNSGGNIEVTLSLTAGTIVGQGVEVFRACGDTSIFCSLVDEDHLVAVEPDSDYRVRVFSYSDLGQAGTFTVCITGDVGTGVQERSSAAFGVFPNPGDGDMTVVYNGPSADAVIHLFDLTGRTVHTERAHLVEGQQRPLALAGRLAPGTYALRVATAFGSAEQRIVIK